MLFHHGGGDYEVAASAAATAARSRMEEKITVTSYYAHRGNTDERRARLLKGSQDDVARLEAGLAAGWDVGADLARAKAQVKAFGG